MNAEPLDITVTVRSRHELSLRDQVRVINRVRRAIKGLQAIAEVEFYEEPTRPRVLELRQD